MNHLTDSPNLLLFLPPPPPDGDPLFLLKITGALVQINQCITQLLPRCQRLWDTSSFFYSHNLGMRVYIQLCISIVSFSSILISSCLGQKVSLFLQRPITPHKLNNGPIHYFVITSQLGCSLKALIQRGHRPPRSGVIVIHTPFSLNGEY